MIIAAKENKKVFVPNYSKIMSLSKKYFSLLTTFWADFTQSDFWFNRLILQAELISLNRKTGIACIELANKERKQIIIKDVFSFSSNSPRHLCKIKDSLLAFRTTHFDAHTKSSFGAVHQSSFHYPEKLPAEVLACFQPHGEKESAGWTFNEPAAFTEVIIHPETVFNTEFFQPS